MKSLENTRLLRKDVLVRQIDVNELHQGVIHIVDTETKNEAMYYYEVLKIAESVTMCSVGDTVILKHLHHTPPVEIDGVKCALTSEDDIEGVVE